MSDPYSALRDQYDETHDKLADALTTIAELRAESERLGSALAFSESRRLELLQDNSRLRAQGSRAERAEADLAEAVDLLLVFYEHSDDTTDPWITDALPLTLGLLKRHGVTR